MSAANVVPIHPHIVLGRMENTIDRITAWAITHDGEDHQKDILLYYAHHLREQIGELSQILQKSELEARLEASIAGLEQNVPQAPKQQRLKRDRSKLNANGAPSEDAPHGLLKGD